MTIIFLIILFFSNFLKCKAAKIIFPLDLQTRFQPREAFVINTLHLPTNNRLLASLHSFQEYILVNESIRLNTKPEEMRFKVNIKKIPQSNALISANIPDNTVTEYWNKAISDIKYNKTLSKVLYIDQTESNNKDGEFLDFHNKFKILIIQSLVLDLIENLNLTRNLKIIGKIFFLKPLKHLINQLSRNTPIQMDLRVELWPEVRFKIPYKGLSITVPRPPYPKELMWNLTLDQLSLQHAVPGELILNRPASWKDLVDIEILNIFKKPSNSKSREKFEYPGLDKGLHEIIMEKEWNPFGLCEGLIGISKNEERYIDVQLPSLHNTSNNPDISELNSKIAALNLQDNDPDRNLDYKRLKGALHDSITKVKNSELLNQIIEVVVQVKCLKIRNRIPPLLNDDFFIKICNRTRNEIKNDIEEYALKNIEQSNHKARRGSIERKLSSIIEIEFPYSYLEEQLDIHWKKYLTNKQISDENDTGQALDFNTWKERNFEALQEDLKLSLAIRYIRQIEKIPVNEEQIIQNILLFKQKVPMANLGSITDWVFRAKETEAVYDWIANNANISYYIDNRPVSFSVSQPGTNLPDSSLVSFPLGSSSESYHNDTKIQASKIEDMLFLKNKIFIDQNNTRDQNS